MIKKGNKYYCKLQGDNSVFDVILIKLLAVNNDYVVFTEYNKEAEIKGMLKSDLKKTIITKEYNLLEKFLGIIKSKFNRKTKKSKVNKKTLGLKKKKVK